MSTPQRLQLSRRKGFDLQALSNCANGRMAVSVARPGKWGNPYYPGCGLGFGAFDADGRAAYWPLRTAEDMVRHFREHVTSMQRYEPQRYREYISPLRGKNLACWCKPGEPCHADVLLECAAVGD